MKIRKRKTEEIVDVIAHNCCTVRSDTDYVSYIDSEGYEHDRESLNLYWDFEQIEETKEEDSHWQDVRERAAIAAMQRLLANGKPLEIISGRETIAKAALLCADALIKELKTK